MNFSLKKLYFFFNKRKLQRKKNDCLKKDLENQVDLDNQYHLFCNNCNNLKHQRYIFENKENNQRYCLTCLKDEYFFKRYSTCQYCLDNLYRESNKNLLYNHKVILIFDQNHKTVNLCNHCFQEEYDYSLAIIGP